MSLRYIPRNHAQLAGELSLKAWSLEEAERNGTTPTAIQARLRRGRYPQVKVRKVNHKVVFVKP